jgi:hypothetical protein
MVLFTYPCSNAGSKDVVLSPKAIENSNLLIQGITAGSYLAMLHLSIWRNEQGGRPGGFFGSDVSKKAALLRASEPGEKWTSMGDLV